MLAIERHKFILKQLAENGQVTTNELCEKLGVSPATVRSDLNKLEKERRVMKTHGGATLLGEGESSPLPVEPLAFPSAFSFKARSGKSNAEKDAISEYALQYMKDNQCILLDASSTALSLAKKLDRFHRLTVITSGIYTMLALKEMPNITVIFIGGIVTKNSGSIEGLLGTDIFNHIHADLAFVSANGFTLSEGLTDFNVYEVELKKEMVRHSKNLIALLDASKLENISTACFCPADQIDVMLTDESADPKIVDAYRNNGIQVEVCSYVR